MFKVNIYRGKFIESSHNIKALVINNKNKIIYSTKNNNDYIYPRSAIKIFQSIPFVLSGAPEYYKINTAQIALSASSHFGEKKHINYLKNWLNKIKVREKLLKCGVHNPLNLESSNKLLLKGKKPSEIHNNCSGKHLGMISTSKFKGYNLSNYTNFNHPIQKEILNILENFTESKISNKYKAVDGCSAPQYAFKIESLSLAMSKIASFNELDFKISLVINKLLYSIANNPFFIGGTNRFDSELIRITKGRLFCKIGAEGVLLFADIHNKYGGVIKVLDGNQRAIPSAAITLLKKIKSINASEQKKIK